MYLKRKHTVDRCLRVGIIDSISPNHFNDERGEREEGLFESLLALGVSARKTRVQSKEQI